MLLVDKLWIHSNGHLVGDVGKIIDFIKHDSPCTSVQQF